LYDPECTSGVLLNFQEANQMDVELTAQTRTKTGKGAARCLRREDKVPATFYGPKTEPLSLSVEARRLEKLLRDMGEESKLLRLTIHDGVESQTRQVLIREIQVHPARRRFLHVDFYEVPLDHAIEVEVPVELVGDSVGVKKGGTLDLIRRTLGVRCLPGDIPDKIQIDVSGLDLGESVRVTDLFELVPFELVDDRTTTVVSIAVPEGTTKEGESAEGSKGE
jgi:large subunit ribosomal protein L25